MSVWYINQTSNDAKEAVSCITMSISLVTELAKSETEELASLLCPCLRPASSAVWPLGLLPGLLPGVLVKWTQTQLSSLPASMNTEHMKSPFYKLFCGKNIILNFFKRKRESKHKQNNKNRMTQTVEEVKKMCAICYILLNRIIQICKTWILILTLFFFQNR